MKLPQLHLRDQFWLTLVVAMCCAWWVDHFRISQERADLKRQQEAYAKDFEELISISDSVQKSVEALDGERAKLGMEPVNIFPLGGVKWNRQ